MTISTANHRNDYLGSGSAGPFAYTFRILDAADLRVVKRSVAGVETVLALTTDYTVTGVGRAAGGSVTLVAALAVGERLALLRDVDLTQRTDLRNQGTFYPEVHEDALDRLVMIAQQQQDELDRSVKLPPSVNPDDVDPTLPLPAADKVVGWNSAGTALENKDLSGIAGAVSSVHGRVGAVVAVSGDYTVAQITGAAPLASPAFTGTPTIGGDLVATQPYVDAAVAAAAGAVSSVHGRTGAVVAVSGDYSVAQVTGAAPLASPALTGTPTVPTAAPGTNTTQAASTAFVTAAVAAGSGAVASVFGRTGVIVKQAGDYAVADITGAAPLASPALTGTPTAPTAGGGTNTTQIATTAFVTTAVAAGTGAVASVFGRTGVIVKQAGDYAVADVTGAAPLASPAFTGNPTAPTQASSDDSTRLATTAFVHLVASGGSGGTSDIPAFNVKASPYSAAGNGVADDTAAINAAITAASAAGGGIVYVPKGTYMVDCAYLTGKSLLLQSNVALIGERGSELKAITNSLNGAFAIAYCATKTNVLVRGLTFTGERFTHGGVNDVTSQYGHGLMLVDSTKVRVEDCQFNDMWADGIYIGSATGGADPCEDVVIQHCFFDANRRAGIGMVGCHGGLITGCTSTRTGTVSGNAGVLPMCGIGLEANAGDKALGGGVQDIRIIGNRTEDNQVYGIMVTVDATNVTVLGNIVRAERGYGIYIGGPTYDVKVVNNQVVDMTTTTNVGAIMVATNSQRAVVRGNTLRNVQTTDAAIYVHSGAVDPIIQDNEITLHNQTTPGGNAINANAPRSIVRGNYIKGSTGIGVNVGSAAIDAIVDHNYIEFAKGRGIYVGGTRPMVRGNVVVNIDTVAGAYIQLDSGVAFPVVLSNVCRISNANPFIADTSILPLRIDAVASATATVIGNVSIGLKALKIDHVASEVSDDRGNASVTLAPDVDTYEQRFDTTLTANRTVTLSTTRVRRGCRFRIVRTGLGAFTLNVGGLKTIPSATAAWVDVAHDGTAWKLSGYGTL